MNYDPSISLPYQLNMRMSYQQRSESDTWTQLMQSNDESHTWSPALEKYKSHFLNVTSNFNLPEPRFNRHPDQKNSEGVKPHICEDLQY